MSMKFLIISSYLPSILRFRSKLLETIQKQDMEIHIFAPDLENFFEEKSKLERLGYYVYDIPMQRTGSNPIVDLNTLRSMYTLIKKIKPDYVLSYTIKPVIYGTLAAWLAKVPYRYALITGLGYAFQHVESQSKRSIFQKLVHSLYQQALLRTHKVFFQNQDDLELFRDLKILNTHTPAIIVNGSGVDITDFNIVPLPVNAENKTKISFLLIARLLADKGVREYVQAAKIIKYRYPHVEFNLVGWIDTNPTAITQTELNHWINDNILNYWGRLSDVKPAIAESSIYVLPSYREGTPRTVLEAMAMGRAIITTDAPGCRETVVHGDNGFMVEVKSVESLVNAMERLITQPELIVKMGQRSREIVVHKYDVHQVNKHMMQEMGLI